MLNFTKIRHAPATPPSERKSAKEKKSEISSEKLKKIEKF